MPITLPAFDQYQAPIVPLRGLWNSKPPEGDRFVNIEIDWFTTTNQRCVQFALSANSPVAISQIVALCVDNRRSGYDVDFVFPDSGFTLTVPAYNQGIYPVFTNALMFYALVPPTAVPGNITVFQVLNSMPPPVALNPSTMQTIDTLIGVHIANGTTQVIPPNISGTLNGFIVTLNSTVPGNAELQLIDGQGTIIWQDSFVTSSNQSQVVNISGLSIRFVNGLSLVVSGSTIGAGAVANVNVFYTTP